MIRAASLMALAASVCAVETNPVPVLRVIDGDTIEVQADLGGQAVPVRVRLLYVNTPEAGDNQHSKAMPEGKAAADWMRTRLPRGHLVRLAGPGAELERDAHGSVLAVVWAEESGAVGAGTPIGDPSREHPAAWRENVNSQLIAEGWSPYWRKYGEAAGRAHEALVESEKRAKSASAGAWATAPQWMQDKANERTAPRSDLHEGEE